MTPVVVSSVVDAINNKNKAALTKMMTPAMASMYTSALARMGENGYDIKIDIKSLDNVKFWSTAQARIAITLSQRGKVVDQDEGYMPIVVSMASPTYPQISEAPTIFTDGNVESDISDHKIPFEWRVSDLFLKITNKEIRAIDRVRVL
ncbi:hypothetical protein IW147_002723 [Coemansia sp. RSA 720]|nr:hypothetical protein IW147_002723 [Coemansia sp. RSA 720]